MSKPSNNSHPKFTNTIFTSLSPFRNSSSLFPSHDRRIGLTVSSGYHPESRCVMVLVEEEQPSFISSQLGEYVEPDKAESFTRERISQIVDLCRKQSMELTEHANRLEQLLLQSTPIIDDSKIDKDEDHKIRIEDRVVRSSLSTSSSKAAPYHPVSRHSQPLDLDEI